MTTAEARAETSEHTGTKRKPGTVIWTGMVGWGVDVDVGAGAGACLCADIQ